MKELNTILAAADGDYWADIIVAVLVLGGFCLAFASLAYIGLSIAGAF